MTNRNTNFEYKVSGSVVITSRVTLDPKNNHAALGGIDGAPNRQVSYCTGIGDSVMPDQSRTVR